VGEIPELLADGGGFAEALPGDLATLAAELERLLDPALRRAQGDAGRKTVIHRFGLERYVRDYEAAIFPGAG
jgi:glycosyltransferase involved in cell wall biosynthesis